MTETQQHSLPAASPIHPNKTTTIKLPYVYAKLQLCVATLLPRVFIPSTPSLLHPHAVSHRTFLDFNADLTEKVFMGSMKSALRSLHGTVGGNIGIHVLQHQHGTGIIKVPSR